VAKTKDQWVTTELVSEEFVKQGGNQSATARALGIHRRTVDRHLRQTGLLKKPLAGGKRHAEGLKTNLPAKGTIKRFILTSAQNNTHVHKAFWANLTAMADHYDAKILVGTFSYNQNNFGRLAVKQGTKKAYESTLWFDPAVKPYIADEKIELAPGLTWCGNMNILPTMDNPISGLETYEGSNSTIFPHTKIEMRSIATTPDLPTKMIYTTGACTLMNYIQKKEGIKAEHHHRYAFLLVEVDDKGNWWARQVAARKSGRVIQDLNVIVEGGEVITDDAKVDAITWGDLHGTLAQPEVVDASQIMLDELKPRYQFIHDIFEGISVNPHLRKYKAIHEKFSAWKRGLHRVEEELKQTRPVLERYLRPWCKTVCPDANHDRAWFKKWLREYDYRPDPPNTQIFLRMQDFMYSQLDKGVLAKNVNLTKFVLEREAGLKEGAIKFLLPDEPYQVEEVECGMHGHLGPNGAFGSPSNLAKIGKKASTAHTHSCGIYHGLYVAGTSSKLTTEWDYTSGPTSWSHSHVVQYPNGQRAIVTMKIVDGVAKWRA
jgi:hypothetical protein